MLSVLIGLIVTTLCISLCAFIVSIIDTPLKVINILNSINLGIGSYVSGYVSAIKRQRSGIFSGTLCGLIISLSIVFLGIVFNIKGEMLSKVCKIVICVICGALGGIKSANSHSI